MWKEKSLNLKERQTQIGGKAGVVFVKKQRRFSGAIAAGLAAWCLLLAFLLGGVSFLISAKWFYQMEYKKYGQAESIGMTEWTLTKVTDGLLDYLQGLRPDLNMQVEIGGQNVEVFTQREKDHMVDVKKLIDLAKEALYFFSLMGLLFAAIAVARAVRNRTERGMGWGYLIGAGSFLLAALGLTAFFVIDFTRAFTAFHQVFFNNDLWLLPPDSVMIRMVPEPFFRDCALVLLLFFIAGLLLTGTPAALCAFLIKGPGGAAKLKEKKSEQKAETSPLPGPEPASAQPLLRQEPMAASQTPGNIAQSQTPSGEAMYRVAGAADERPNAEQIFQNLGLGDENDEIQTQRRPYEEPLGTGTAAAPGIGGNTGYHQPALSANTGYQPPFSGNTDYQAPVSANTGYQPPASANTGYQPPVSAETGYQPPVSTSTGYQASMSANTGYQPPVSADTGYQPPFSGDTGYNQAPMSVNTGYQPPLSGDTSYNQPPVSANTGYQPPLSGDTSYNQAPASANAGYQSPVGANTGYQPLFGGNTGYNQSPVSTNTGYQAPVSANTGYQPPVGANTGYQPPFSGDTGRQPAANANTGYQPQANQNTGFQQPILPAVDADGKPLTPDGLRLEMKLNLKVVRTDKGFELKADNNLPLDVKFLTNEGELDRMVGEAAGAAAQPLPPGNAAAPAQQAQAFGVPGAQAFTAPQVFGAAMRQEPPRPLAAAPMQPEPAPRQQAPLYPSNAEPPSVEDLLSRMDAMMKGFPEKKKDEG
ncbi:MAG: TIGR01906 family membrane protein [Christensenellaceae bacterium]|jgi:integral membrane protein (TIGR01906 family)|nr:TIGR01906 family membrane protein [Christensenellaceae bacterium]